MTPMTDFPANVRAVLTAKKLRQTELARRLKVSPAMISQWLSGKRRPTLATILRIADALNVRPSRLVS